MNAKKAAKKIPAVFSIDFSDVEVARKLARRINSLRKQYAKIRAAKGAVCIDRRVQLELEICRTLVSGSKADVAKIVN